MNFMGNAENSEIFVAGYFGGEVETRWEERASLPGFAWWDRGFMSAGGTEFGRQAN